MNSFVAADTDVHDVQSTIPTTMTDWDDVMSMVWRFLPTHPAPAFQPIPSSCFHFLEVSTHPLRVNRLIRVRAENDTRHLTQQIQPSESCSSLLGTFPKFFQSNPDLIRMTLFVDHSHFTGPS